MLLVIICYVSPNADIIDKGNVYFFNLYTFYFTCLDGSVGKHVRMQGDILYLTLPFILLFIGNNISGAMSG